MLKTILVVEDDPALVRLYQMTLKESYDILVAYNGHEALEQVKSHIPDLIVMDVMMPVMDGLEALARLKENSETTSIPVILLTAKVQHKDVLEGYQTGADYYITKPFTSRELLNGINLCLNNGKA